MRALGIIRKKKSMQNFHFFWFLGQKNDEKLKQTNFLEFLPFCMFNSGQIKEKRSKLGGVIMLFLRVRKNKQKKPQKLKKPQNL